MKDTERKNHMCTGPSTDKEVLDDNHHKGKVANDELFAKNKERSFYITMYFEPDNKILRRKERSIKIKMISSSHWQNSDLVDLR